MRYSKLVNVPVDVPWVPEPEKSKTKKLKKQRKRKGEREGREETLFLPIFSFFPILFFNFFSINPHLALAPSTVDDSTGFNHRFNSKATNNLKANKLHSATK